VLAAGGRAVVSVFQRLECHPFYVALHESIGRHLGSSGVADIFALGDADALRALLARAGFREVDFAPVEVTARFPGPAQFLAGEIDVDTAAIPAMRHLNATARQDLTATIREDMAGPLREATEGEYVILPFHIYFVRAHRDGQGT
jgi:hypothetical protein